MGQALSWGRSLPSPAWTLVTPYCKRTRPGRGTNTKAAGFPPLSRPSPATSLPPFVLAHALDPSGLGHAATFTRRLRDPRSRNADTMSYRRSYVVSSCTPSINPNVIDAKIWGVCLYLLVCMLQHCWRQATLRGGQPSKPFFFTHINYATSQYMRHVHTISLFPSSQVTCICSVVLAKT
jgi:hypothetical protein